MATNPMLAPTFNADGEVLYVAFDHPAVRTYRGPDWAVKNAAAELLAPRAVAMLADNAHWAVTYDDVIDPSKEVTVPINSHGFRSTTDVAPCLPAGWVNAGTYTITPGPPA